MFNNFFYKLGQSQTSLNRGSDFYMISQRKNRGIPQAMHPKSSNSQLMIHIVGDHLQATMAAVWNLISFAENISIQNCYAMVWHRAKHHQVWHALFLIGPRIPGGSCSLGNQVMPPSSDLFMAPLHLNELWLAPGQKFIYFFGSAGPS